MQQINLYLPEFRPHRDYFSVENSGIFLLLLLVLMIFLQLSRSSQLNVLESQVTELEMQLQKQKDQVETLKKTPVLGRSAALEQEVAQTREAIRNREAIAQVIGGQSLGNQTGFSRQLLALGEQRVEGISLQSFNLRRGGAFARLEGVSLKAESVPLYVARLQGDPSFAATRFGFLSLRSSDTGVQFLLSGDGPVTEETLGYLAEKNAGGYDAIENPVTQSQTP
jgi:hypothetical protein